MASSVCIACTSWCVKEADTRHVGSRPAETKVSCTHSFFCMLPDRVQFIEETKKKEGRERRD
jgi:hypothetical protein